MSNLDEREKIQPDHINSSRRSFISLLPIGIFGVMATSFGVALKRFFSPQIINAEEKIAAKETWMVLGSLSELKSEEPIAKAITVERHTGWAKTVEKQIVYVLPKHDYRVVSSICPHEGCPVVWDAQQKNFVCPCHDSLFSDGGKHLSGPSNGDMAQLPMKVEDGKIKIQNLG